MNKILNNIHWLFWGCIPIFLLYGIIRFDEAIDINIHDTMFVIAFFYIMILLSLFYLVTGFLYYYIYKNEKFKPVDFLTILHVVLFFLGLVILFFVPEYQYKLPIESATDMQENLRASRFNDSIKLYTWISILIAQVVFIINLTISIFRK